MIITQIVSDKIHGGGRFCKPIGYVQLSVEWTKVPLCVVGIYRAKIILGSFIEFLGSFGCLRERILYYLCLGF